MKGFWILVGIIAVTVFGCVGIPFVFLPNSGIAITLPVIYVPGEHLEKLGYLPGGVPVTNTFLAAFITSIFLLVTIILAVGNPKEVPTRGQALVELIVEAWYGLAKQVAGAKGRQLLPLMLTIFFFVLVANLMKIFPGVDTIGELHCAGLIPGVEPENYALGEEDPQYKADAEEAYIAFSGYEKTELAGMNRLKNEEPLNTGDKMSYLQYKGCKERLHGAHGAEGEDHGAAEGEDHAATEGEDHAAATEGEAAATEGEDHAATEGEAVAVAEAGDGEDEDAYPTDNADHGQDYDRYNVTPFIRGATTDLSLTMAIALVAIILVQFYGIKELGVLGWGVKFINLPALEKPGVNSINFVVGLLETVLEFAKIVSFAFRLFGSMFAGQVLMFVIVFLVGAFVPIAVLGLEVFVGVIQAFVFAILFLMFASVAMTPHHGDDHDEAHEHH